MGIVLFGLAARAAGLWATEGRASQRVFRGAVKTADMRHDIAVYLAAGEAHARIEEAARGCVDRCGQALGLRRKEG